MVMVLYGTSERHFFFPLALADKAPSGSGNTRTNIISRIRSNSIKQQQQQLEEEIGIGGLRVVDLWWLAQQVV